MLRARSHHTIILFALTLWACGGTSQMAEDDVAPQRSTRNRLVHQDMLETTALTAYDAIRQLRPMWLRARGNVPSGAEPLLPVVYVDGVRAGELNYLRQLRVEEVESARFINPRDATTRWGTGVAGGVIEVSLVRSPT